MRLTTRGCWVTGAPGAGTGGTFAIPDGAVIETEQVVDDGVVNVGLDWDSTRLGPPSLKGRSVAYLVRVHPTPHALISPARGELSTR